MDTILVILNLQPNLQMNLHLNLQKPHTPHDLTWFKTKGPEWRCFVVCIGTVYSVSSVYREKSGGLQPFKDAFYSFLGCCLVSPTVAL